jgi:prophage regulatory protein
MALLRAAFMRTEMKLLSYDELKPAKGIRYSKTQLWRLEKTGGFPRRVSLTGHPNGRHGWVESEIDAWITDRIARRDAPEGGE